MVYREDIGSLLPVNGTCTVLMVFVLANAGSSTASYSIFAKNETRQSAVPSQSKPGSHYVIANGIRIHYREWGSGDSTIVLLHGLYDSSDTWLSIAPLLGNNYRIIAPDRRGAGLSDKPEAGYDDHTLARDVELLIVALKLRRVYLVGHSAGAGVAMTLAATTRGRINKLVLVDGGFWPKREALPAGLKVQTCEADPAECRRRDAIERASKEYDPAKLYARVSVPVLLVLGVPPEEEAKAFAAELSQARQHVESVAKLKLKKGHMAVIEGTSHWIQRDRPKELAMVLDQFLKRSASNKGMQRTRN
ncbi:MAG: alpha/beta fold hydrolase [Pyrinomonadaceae bacterium]